MTEELKRAIAQAKEEIRRSRENGDEPNVASWGYEEGCCISRGQLQLLLDAIKSGGTTEEADAIVGDLFSLLDGIDQKAEEALLYEFLEDAEVTTAYRKRLIRLREILHTPGQDMIKLEGPLTAEPKKGETCYFRREGYFFQAPWRGLEDQKEDLDNELVYSYTPSGAASVMIGYKPGQKPNEL